MKDAKFSHNCSIFQYVHSVWQIDEVWRFVLHINDFDEQIVEPKNDFSNFNLANELASNLENFNKNSNLGQLVFNENNNIAQAKIDKNLIFDSDHFDDDLELNDWFYDIEFKFDSKKKHEHSQIVAKLKQKWGTIAAPLAERKLMRVISN